MSISSNEYSALIDDIEYFLSNTQTDYNSDDITPEQSNFENRLLDELNKYTTNLETIVPVKEDNIMTSKISDTFMGTTTIANNVLDAIAENFLDKITGDTIVEDVVSPFTDSLHDGYNFDSVFNVDNIKQPEKEYIATPTSSLSTTVNKPTNESNAPNKSAVLVSNVVTSNTTSLVITSVKPEKNTVTNLVKSKTIKENNNLAKKQNSTTAFTYNPTRIVYKPSTPQPIVNKHNILNWNHTKPIATINKSINNFTIVKPEKFVSQKNTNTIPFEIVNIDQNKTIKFINQNDFNNLPKETKLFLLNLSKSNKDKFTIHKKDNLLATSSQKRSLSDNTKNCFKRQKLNNNLCMNTFTTIPIKSVKVNIANKDNVVYRDSLKKEIVHKQTTKPNTTVPKLKVLYNMKKENPIKRKSFLVDSSVIIKMDLLFEKLYIATQGNSLQMERCLKTFIEMTNALTVPI